MTEERKQEIINILFDVYNNYEIPEDQDHMSMFDLISGYNRNYNNKELIGGAWVRENCPEPLRSLP